MNLILTTDCQRKCQYCFAKDNLENPMQFTMENFKKVIDWIETDIRDVDRIALLGGEPTLHPDFINFIKYLLPRKLGILVFTNAMVENKDFYKDIIDIAIENSVSSFPELGFCVNINEPKYRSKKENELQNLFFERLGRVSSLSFNIFEKEFNPYFLISTIKKYGLVKNIRLGIAVPLGNRNKHLKVEYYSNVAIKIMEFIRLAVEHKIIVGFDCGFTRCMFTEKNLQELNSLKTGSITFDCGPSIDIYPSMEATSCYPMSHILRENILDYTSFRELFYIWKQKFNKFNNIYLECIDCTHYIHYNCDGGCKAYKANG